MKKTIIIILSIFVAILLIVTIVFFMQIDSLKEMKKELDSDSEYFLQYNDIQFEVNDFISIMNKAIEINENYGIQKDENNFYSEDDKYSVKIYLRLDNREELIPMEKLLLSKQGGSNVINTLFSDIVYRYESISYHEKTKRVRQIVIYGFTKSYEVNFQPYK